MQQADPSWHAMPRRPTFVYVCARRGRFAQRIGRPQHGLGGPLLPSAWCAEADRAAPLPSIPASWAAIPGGVSARLVLRLPPRPRVVPPSLARHSARHAGSAAPKRTNSGHFRPAIRPTLAQANLGPTPANPRSNSDHCGAKSAELEPNSAQLQPASPRDWSNLGRFRA